MSGHLDGVTAVVEREADATVFTGGRDGMVLGWGQRWGSEKEEEGGEDDATEAFFA